MKVMKWVIMTCIIVGMGNAGTASGRAVLKTIAPDVKMVSDTLQSVLDKESIPYKDSSWPEDIEKAKVEMARVPQKVMAETTCWLRTMIKSEYLPREPNEWLIAVRKPKPGYFRVERGPEGVRKVHIGQKGTNDYLIMRYSIDGHKLQIQENGAAVRLLIDVNNPTTFGSNAEEFITNTIYEFLNYPEGQKNSLEFYLRSLAYNDKTIHFGTVDCNFRRGETEAYSKRIWWNHTGVWTDGKRIYLSLVERDGKPIEARQARPGIRPRFRKGDK
jgi:hypothetical protein